MENTLLLFPNITTAKKAHDQLLDMGVEPDEVHVLTKNQMGSEFFEHKTASLSTYTDVLPALCKGFLMGASVGFTAHLFFENFINLAQVPFGSTFVWCMLFGGIGAWFSTLVGISTSKPRFKKYLKFIQAGHALLILKNANSKLKHRIQHEFPVELSESYASVIS